MLHADETPVSDAGPRRGQDQEGLRLGAMRAASSMPSLASIYDFCLGRGAKYPVRFLGPPREGEARLARHARARTNTALMLRPKMCGACSQCHRCIWEQAGGTAHITSAVLAYRRRMNSITDGARVCRGQGVVSAMSTLASALAFISRSTSA